MQRIRRLDDNALRRYVKGRFTSHSHYIYNDITL